jgi:hypothetical protein
MENITAKFNSQTEMESAAHMLREQGVIDINLQSREAEQTNMAESMEPSMTNGTIDSASGFVMQVVVESSRYRQVEDTIARCGGQYEVQYGGQGEGLS